MQECDNSAGSFEIECSYSMKIGTFYSAEIQEGASINVTIGTEISAQLFELFSFEVGISVETGYDWTEVNKEVKGEVQETQVGSFADSFSFFFFPADPRGIT